MEPLALVAQRYELDRELARGGMGVVYRARDCTSGEIVALKRSLPGALASRSALSRSMLEREYQTLRTLRHPRIIQVYDFGVDEQGPYYTMEMLDGVDLRSRCPLPWREVCGYLRDVASSLSLLHSRRLIHRDVTVGNIRLTGEGRAKLLDFGALTSFGVPANLVGTAVTTAPEALDHKQLDQRADLYSLGATAYYALCGRHPYPAKSLSLLPAAWAQGRPQPPSAHVPDIPRELDELVLSLIDLDPASRPSTAAEVMDRLGAIAGIPPDHDQRVQRSYLYGAELVGRDEERKRLGGRLLQMLKGAGGGVLIEGAPGLGKGFLLEDCVQRAQLSAARVISVQARAHPHVQGVWSEILRQAERLLLGAALSAEHATDVAQAPTAASLYALSGQAPLLLAIDDLHEADRESIAALASLAKEARDKRILLLATLDPSHAERNQDVIRLLRSRLSKLTLRPLDEAATHAFVTGLFGEVSALARLSAFLLNHAGGNPRAYTEVVQHLIARDYIRYAEGTWVLPDELPDGMELAALVDSALDARIAALSPAARILASCLSPHRRVFNAELCRYVAEGDRALRGCDAQALLRELLAEGVLIEERGRYLFARSRLRDLLYERMTVEQRQARHGRIAEAIRLTTGKEATRGFEIGYHLLLAGREPEARAEINRAAEPSLFDPDLLVSWVPDLLFIAQQQRSVGATDEDLQFVEGLLVLSGYYSDPSIQTRLARRVLPMLQRTVGFALANRLKPWLGAYLAVGIGLFFAWIRNATRRPVFVVAGRKLLAPIMLFTSACVGFSAGACFRLEYETHPYLQKLLGVASGLFRHNGLRLIYDLFGVGACVVRGRFREADAGLEDQLRRVHHIPGLEGGAKDNYESGLWLFIGRSQLLRLDSKTLACADRIDTLGGPPHDRLMAHFLRRTYYLYRGEVGRAQEAEERFDEMAARVGSRWVADSMSVAEIAPYHLSGDVIGLKRALHRIDRLVPIAPNLALQREMIRAMYEGHRGRPDRALAIYAGLEAELLPFHNPGWAAARAHQAECLNALGRHDAALEVCEAARSHLTPADRVYVFAYQQLERETAHALSGLGRNVAAATLIEQLLDECSRYDNPLALGLLHNDRARIALAAHDRPAFERHFQAAKDAFFSTRNPTLIAKVRRLEERGVAASLLGVTPLPAKGQVSPKVTLLERERAEQVLAEAVRLVKPEAAFLYLVAQGEPVLVARHGDAEPAPPVHEQVADFTRGPESGLHESVTPVDADITQVDARIVPLVTRAPGTRGALVGLLVLQQGHDELALEELDVSALSSILRDDEEAETAALRA